jgi:Flp pilus assembly protein TadG
MKAKETMKKLRLTFDESGGVALFVALAFAVICGFAALAFDYGHLVMVRSELQRTTDAAALAGAMGLAPYLSPTTPYWEGGVSKAHEVISNAANGADGQVFSDTDGTVVYGYWLLNPPNGYTEFPLPIVRPATAAYVPEPAVSVTLRRNVELYFAPLVGVSSSKSVSARSTAILPETYTITGAPPIAVTHDTVFNPNPDGTWTIDTSQLDIKPQSNKGVAGWFNFDTIDNKNQSVPSVRDMQSTDITQTVTEVHFVPGTKATLMDYVSVGETVILPYVNDTDLAQGNNAVIQGFGGFKITSLDANSMTGYFVPYSYSPNVKISVPGSSDPSPVWGMPKLVSP